MSEENKKDDPSITVEGETIPTNKLSPQQQYFYNQCMDIQPRLEKHKFKADQLQASFKAFEKALFDSIKKDKEELNKKLEESDNKEK